MVYGYPYNVLAVEFLSPSRSFSANPLGGSRMQAVTLFACAVVFCLSTAVPTFAQTSASDVAVFAATAPAPASTPQPARIDSRSMTEIVANSVVNGAGGGEAGSWDSSLGYFTTGRADIDKLILASGSRHGVDPKLIASVMQQESGFRAGATSNKGACGYMQLMPGTARRFGVTNIYDPQQNIDAGARYLRFLLDLFRNDVSLALAGYNAGEYRVIRNGYRVPMISETQNYVRLITSRYFRNAPATMRSVKRYTVTVGVSTMDEVQRAEIVRAAYASTDERGVDTLSNY